MTKMYKAKIMLPNGVLTERQARAQHTLEAKQIFETYGKVVGGPFEVMNPQTNTSWF